jgi:hypothetical protein
MYTDGIRKIFSTGCFKGTMTLEEVKELAEKSGYRAFEFNGLIYIKCSNDTVGDHWVQTLFDMRDFEV